MLTESSPSMRRWWIDESIVLASSNPSDDDLSALRSEGFCVAVSLLDAPNPWLTAWELWYLTVVYLELTGNCFWYVAPTEAGTPAELWVIPTPWVKVLPDPAAFASTVRAHLHAGGTLISAARSLVEFANAAGGADNITVALIPVSSPAPADEQVTAPVDEKVKE